MNGSSICWFVKLITLDDSINCQRRTTILKWDFTCHNNLRLHNDHCPIPTLDENMGCTHSCYRPCALIPSNHLGRQTSVMFLTMYHPGWPQTDWVDHQSNHFVIMTFIASLLRLNTWLGNCCCHKKQNTVTEVVLKIEVFCVGGRKFRLRWPKDERVRV